MKVGLNLLFLVPGETGGMETYARELIPAMLEAAPEVTFTAFLSREAASGGDWDELVETEVLPVRAANRADLVRGEQLLLPRRAARRGVDLLHSLANTGPLRGRFRRVTSIHDLLFMSIPEAHFGLRARGLRLLVPATARRADRLIAISRTTRDEIVERLRIPAERIDVVPQGFGLSMEAEPMPEGELRERFDLGGRPVVLTVSAKRAHKNLIRLLEAHALIPAEERPVLVMPGYPTPHEAELRDRAARLGTEGEVRLLGWLPAAELEGLYRAAACFAFPSRYEGFGLPVLEAMARGLPVACSRIDPLVEVAGDAALLFDPERVDEIAAAMRSLLTDRALATRLAEGGRARAAQFTWERTAQGTLDCYRRLMGGAS